MKKNLKISKLAERATKSKVRVPRGSVPPPPKDIIKPTMFYRRYPDNPIGRLNYV